MAVMCRKTFAKQGPEQPNLDDEDHLSLSKTQTKCEGCSKYVLVGSVYVHHYEMAVTYQRSLHYHVPCWLANDRRSRTKPLSEYKGFDKLSETLQEEVVSAFPGSTTDIREDPSSPAPMVKPTMTKRCLALTVDGKQCRFNTGSGHPKAEPLFEDGCHKCEVHRNSFVRPETICEYEAERKKDFQIKRLQFERNEGKSKKRARKD
jgi:hypothetical protein